LFNNLIEKFCPFILKTFAILYTHKIYSGQLADSGQWRTADTSGHNLAGTREFACRLGAQLGQWLRY